MGVIKKQSILSAIVIYLGVILGFLNVGVLMPKFFTPAEIGVRSLLVDFTTLFITFSLLGINTSIIKYHSKFKVGDKVKGYFSYFFIIGACSLFVWLGLLYFSENYIRHIYNSSDLFNDHFHLVYLMSVFFTFNNLIESVCKCLRKIFIISLIKDVIFRLIFILFIILYIYDAINFDEFITLFCYSYFLVGFILLLILLLLGHLDLSVNKELLTLDFNKGFAKFALTTFLFSAASVLVFKIDTLMIGSLLKDENIDSSHFVGLYSMALFFVATIDIPRRSISQINAPLISHFFENDEYESIEEIYQKTSNTLCGLGVLLGGLLLSCFYNVLDIIPNGVRFYEIYWPLVFLTCSKLIQMIFSSNGEILLYSNYYKYNLIFILILIFFSVSFNYIFISFYGITGAAIATFISISLFSLMKFIFIKIKFKFKLFNKNILFMIILGFALTIISFNLEIQINSYLQVIIKTTFFSVVYIYMLYKFNLSPELKKIMENLIRSFKTFY